MSPTQAKARGRGGLPEQHGQDDKPKRTTIGWGEYLAAVVAWRVAHPPTHKPEIWLNDTDGDRLWIGTEPLWSHTIPDQIELLIPYLVAEQANARARSEASAWLRRLCREVAPR
jgi:hypothetical protein